MSWNWRNAVDNARELATAAKNSQDQEKHIPTLIKCILDLCDAVEDIAEKVGVSGEENEE